MLRIYGEAIEMLRVLRPVLERIQARDSDLAKQLRRCSSSVALNIAEGSGAKGGNRRALFAVAYGSLRETRACLEVANALGYLESVDAGVGRRLHEIGGALYRLSA
jgi:four helix bundle protein